jgi:hypothetical protein
MRLFSFSGLFIPHAPVGSVKGMFFLISLASHNNTIQLGLLFFSSKVQVGLITSS